jgi:hypothetical protein
MDTTIMVTLRPEKIARIFAAVVSAGNARTDETGLRRGAECGMADASGRLTA